MTALLGFKGTLQEVDTAGGSTYANIVDLEGLQPPMKERAVGETTVSASPNDYREYTVPGFKDGGTVAFTLRLHKTQFATLDTAFEASTLCTWKTKLPLLTGESTASNWVFSGHMTKLAPQRNTVAGADPWNVDIEVKVTGKPVWTSGS